MRGLYVLYEGFVDGGGCMDARHNNFSCNFLFSDGHAANMPTNVRVSRYLYTSSINPYMSPPFDRWSNNMFWDNEGN